MLSFFEYKTDDDLLQKYLLVEIAASVYAFKIEYVQEIVPIIEIFTVETLNNNISGLINLRGESIPVYDLSSLLGKDSLKFNIAQKLLILTVAGAKFAIVIDRVDDIIPILSENISSLSYTLNINFLATTVINAKTVIVIDVENFKTYITSSENSVHLNTRALVPTDGAALEKLKARTALLTRTNDSSLIEDNFFNEKFIVFSLGQEYYSFNISYVKEIKKIPVSSISEIPSVPEFVMGIINFQGDYIGVLDIKAFLNMNITPLPEKISLIVLNLNNLCVAIVVDEIIDVTNLPISNLNSEADLSESYIIGELMFNDKLLNMLNIEKLFSAENINVEDYE